MLNPECHFPYSWELNRADSGCKRKTVVTVTDGILLFFHGRDKALVALPFPTAQLVPGGRRSLVLLHPLHGPFM